MVGPAVVKSVWLWEALILSNSTYDVEKHVLDFMISTSHFMICFGDLPETIQILGCVLKTTVNEVL